MAQSGLNLKLKYQRAIAKKLDKLDKCPSRGYYSSSLGGRVEGFSDVCRSLANLNKLYKELSIQEGIELKLVEISVPEEEGLLG